MMERGWFGPTVAPAVPTVKRILNIDHVVALLRLGRLLGTAHDQAGGEIGGAHDDPAPDRRPQVRHIKAFHQAARPKEQQGIDQDHPQPHRQNDERKRKQQQDGFQDRIEQAQQQNHHDQRGAIRTGNSRHQLRGKYHSQRQHQPSYK